MRKICIVCNKEIIKRVKEGVRDWNLRRFCSPNCYHIYQPTHPNKGIFKVGNHPATEFKKGQPKPKNAYTFPFGESHPNWKGDNAKYTAFHMRLREKFGPANKCEICGKTGKDFRYEWANLTGNYWDINDFKQMCHPCHKEFDISRHRKK